jgi:hypothetical protein
LKKRTRGEEEQYVAVTLKFYVEEECGLTNAERNSTLPADTTHCTQGFLADVVATSSVKSARESDKLSSELSDRTIFVTIQV